MILVTLAGLSAFAMLAAWLVRVDSTTLWPLGEVGHDGFWRRTLPLPRATQDDTEFAWRIPRAVPPADTPRIISVERPVPPTRPQRRILSR